MANFPSSFSQPRGRRRGANTYPMAPTKKPSVVPFISRVKRRRTLLCALVLCLLGVTLLYRTTTGNLTVHDHDLPILDSDYDNSKVTATRAAPPPPPVPPKPKREICLPGTCMSGSWVPRSPAFTSLADVQVVYPPAPRGEWKMCGGEENSREPEDRDSFHANQTQRLVDVMNWVWEPSEGKMRKWDAMAFVVRLLRSPGGLVFSGDSISRQHFNQLEYALSLAGILITEDPPHLPFHDHRRLHQFILRPSDPMTLRLLSLSGVPASRLLRPIYTKIDNHILVGEKDVRKFTKNLGAAEKFPWYDIFEYFEDWELFLEDLARVREDEVEEGVVEDTILVLNTGMHWSRGTFYMLPNAGSAEDQQRRVTQAFKQMVDHVSSRLNSISRLSIYYRTTAPGHPSCTDRPSPYPDLSSALAGEANVMERMALSTDIEDQKVVRQRWDWDRVHTHNAIWETKIKELEGIRKISEGSAGGGGGGGGRMGKVAKRKWGAKWFYMDVWEQALQRPDAHTQNLVDKVNMNFDCLHWCVPGVVEMWTEYLNHLVFWGADSSI